MKRVQPTATRDDKANFPFVSVITPTYNRRRFIPYLIECFKKQTYPARRMEWIIYDDGSDPVKDLFEPYMATIPNLVYIYEKDKQNIGGKRNRLNREACGDIIVAMDDDDYYPEDRVYAVVKAFKQNPGIQLAGSSEVFMYYTDIQTIYKLGPYNKNHATNGTMAWRKAYSETHLYDETVTHAEETSFLNGYKERMVQLDPFRVMLVMAHSENTFDKKKFRENPTPLFALTGLKINRFIRDKKLRDFYSDA